MTIKLIKGFASYYDESSRRIRITTDSGPVTLPADVERAWVARGVAEYVDAKPESKSPASADEPDEAVAAAGTEDGAEDAPEPDAEEDAGYEELSLGELKALCDERHIAYKAKTTKADIIALLEKDDEPPAFDAFEAE